MENVWKQRQRKFSKNNLKNQEEFLIETIMYTPFHFGKLQIENRLVASAMFEYGADNGKITEKIKKHYLEVVEGGTGLLITGMHAVQ